MTLLLSIHPSIALLRGMTEAKAGAMLVEHCPDDGIIGGLMGLLSPSARRHFDPRLGDFPLSHFGVRRPEKGMR